MKIELKMYLFVYYKASQTHYTHRYTRFGIFAMIIELLGDRCEIKRDRTEGINMKVGLFQIDYFLLDERKMCSA